MTVDDKWLTLLLENQCTIMLALAQIRAKDDRESADLLFDMASSTRAIMQRELGYDPEGRT